MSIRKEDCVPKGFPIDKRPAKDGWEQGWYMNICIKCRKKFLGDINSTTCANCAYNDNKQGK